MSIRFKFRSSVNFDVVEIGNRGSISVAELRSRILHGKASNHQQQGFDLVFSDAVSGLEFKGDCEIPCGSSVIVKRVPGETMASAVRVPIEAVKHAGLKESHNANLTKTGPEDELCADLFPMLDVDFPCFSQGLEQRNFMGNNEDDIAVMPRGFNQPGNDRIISPIVNKQMKSNNHLPLELKCPLCNAFFTDAVMIPCCQHSFCKKCEFCMQYQSVRNPQISRICQMLIAKGICPKCSSRRFTVEDLLPNLSLRQAIEHLLESQIFDAGFEGVLQKYVPDEESGIQVKDVSCAFTVVQRELEAPQSSSATGEGSNQVLMEASCEQQYKGNIPFGNRGQRDFDSSCKANPHEEDFAQSTDFQGQNEPVIPEIHGEVYSGAKRKGGFSIGPRVGGRNMLGLGGYRQGFRNCYACGSPDHLMRDCPVSHHNAMFQPGSSVFHGVMPSYAPPYWNSFSYPPCTPYANMYNNPSMMLFNTSVVPLSPFAVPPPYISSTSGNLPGVGGNMQTGYMPLRFDQFGLQLCGNKRAKLSNENLESDQLSDNKAGSSECYQHYSPQKTHHYRSQREKESHSDNTLAQRSGRKHQHIVYNIHCDERQNNHQSLCGREKRLSHMVKSTSAKDKSKSNEWHGEGRHKRHREDSRKDDVDERRRGDCHSNSSTGHPSIHRGVKRRVHSDAQDSHRKHNHGRSEFVFEPRTPAERRAENIGRDACRDSSRHLRERHHGDRLQVAHEDRRDERHHHHKRRAH